MKNRLLVIQEIVNKVTEAPEKNWVLFGEKDYVSDKIKYDFVFHCVEGVNETSKIENLASVTIPVIDGINKDHSTNLLRMYELFLENKSIDKFALCEEKGTLHIYNVIQRKLGKEIKDIGYSFVHEKEFFDLLNKCNSLDIRDDILKRRKEINRKTGSIRKCNTKEWSLSLEYIKIK